MSSAVIKQGDILGVANAPTSKSIAHRLLICAALSQGVSTIKNVDISDDIVATISCLREMGATIDIVDLKNETKVVVKKGIDFNKEELNLNAYSSATTLRLLIPLLTLNPHVATIKMNHDLFVRPNDIYDEIFKNGIIKDNDQFEINSILKSKIYEVKGNVSSQFISGLLLALPLLKSDSEIKVIPPFSSASYVNLTIDAMAKAGVIIEKKTDTDFYIKGGQTYNKFDCTVEGDYSNSANILALGALCGEVCVKGLNQNSLQSDKKITDYLSKMGADVSWLEGDLIVRKGDLKPIDVDLDNNIDIAPLLISLCAITEGISYIRNIHRLRYKESDRAESILEELEKLDCYIENENDNLKIYGGLNSYGGITLDSHNDHRICMALAVIAPMFKFGLKINNIDCVTKSYPCFFEDLRDIGAYVKIEK